MITDFPRQEHIPGLRRLWKEAFGDPDAFLDRFFSTGFSLYRCRCIREGATPVAALYWFDCRWQDKRLAYVYAVATAKSHRGQGLCHQLMASTHSILLQLGYCGVVVVPATAALFDLYRGMGYRPFGGIRQWQASAGEPVPLTALSYKEYAAARKDRLPANSILQEGALLRFLDSYARFWQGADFVACTAEADDGQLFCCELLGNPDAAPGILSALGRHTGSFRAPGAEPFALYRSLTGDHTAPGYFAFALD